MPDQPSNVTTVRYPRVFYPTCYPEHQKEYDRIIREPGGHVGWADGWHYDAADDENEARCEQRVCVGAWIETFDHHEPAVPPNAVEGPSNVTDLTAIIAANPNKVSQITQAICRQAIQRDIAGFDGEYGTTIDRKDVKTSEWMRHTGLELGDAQKYLERAAVDVEALEAENARLTKSLADAAFEITVLKTGGEALEAENAALKAENVALKNENRELYRVVDDEAGDSITLGEVKNALGWPIDSDQRPVEEIQRLRTEIARLRDEQAGDDEPLTVESVNRRWNSGDNIGGDCNLYIDFAGEWNLRRHGWPCGVSIPVANHGQVRRIVEALS